MRAKIEDANVSYAVKKISEAFRLLENKSYKEAEIVGWLLGYIKEKYACKKTGEADKKADGKGDGQPSVVRGGVEVLGPEKSSDSIRVEKGTVIGESGTADYIDYLDQFKNKSAEEKITAFRIMSAIGDGEEMNTVSGTDKIWIEDSNGAKPSDVEAVPVSEGVTVISPPVKPKPKPKPKASTSNRPHKYKKTPEDFDAKDEEQAQKSLDEDIAHILWKQRRENQERMEELARMSRGEPSSGLDDDETIVRASATYEEARLMYSLGDSICINCKHKHKSKSLGEGVLCKKTLRKHDFGDTCALFEFDEN